jgi:hypothetical protein
VGESLSEKANSKQSATQLVKEQGVSHDEIASVPDFEKLFVGDTYARILDMAGYGDNIDNLRYTLEDRASNNGGSGPGGSPFSAEGSGVSQAALLRHLTGAAQRLDALKQPAAANTDRGITGRVNDAADVGLSPGEIVAARHDTAAAAQKVADALSKVRPTRVVPQDGKYAVVLGPKPEVDYPTATVPALRAYTDPEGRQGAASFVSGIEAPDGTTKGLSDPEIRAVAKSIARLVEGGIPAPGQNGVYDAGNNTIRVYGGLSEAEHSRILGHETGHAVEALARVAQQLGMQSG